MGCSVRPSAKMTSRTPLSSAFFAAMSFFFIRPLARGRKSSISSRATPGMTVSGFVDVAQKARRLEEKDHGFYLHGRGQDDGGRVVVGVDDLAVRGHGRRAQDGEIAVPQQCAGGGRR